MFEGRYALELDLRAVAVEVDEGEDLRFVRQGDKDPPGEVVSLATELPILLLVVVEVEEDDDAVDTFDCDRKKVLVWFRCEGDRISIMPSSSSSTVIPA